MTGRVSVIVWMVSALLVGSAVNASVQTRDRESLHSPRPPRILNVYTEDGQLYIAGQNLPAGEGVRVRLGSQTLEIMVTSASLVIARLPSTLPAGEVDLEVGRGVRWARIGGAPVLWGLQLSARQNF
jgi:hypothetical protein